MIWIWQDLKKKKKPALSFHSAVTSTMTECQPMSYKYLVTLKAVFKTFILSVTPLGIGVNGNIH